MKLLILTITLNPSIDRSYYLEGFEKGKVVRAENIQYTPGGKGLNVTKVAKTFNDSVLATGFLGGHSGNFIREKLDELNINHNFIPIEGETRSCLALHSGEGTPTEILEKGPAISKEEFMNFKDLYTELIKKSEIICASGSLPQGLAPDSYKELIEIAKPYNKKFILDTSGDALKIGVEAAPFLIKPNHEELEKYTGHKITSQDGLIKAGKILLDKGIRIVVISLGKEGSLVLTEEYIYKIDIPKVKVVNTVGSGDSMIAGFAISLLEGYDFNTMLKFAAACGTANAMEKETGKVDSDNVKKLMDEININRL